MLSKQIRFVKFDYMIHFKLKPDTTYAHMHQTVIAGSGSAALIAEEPKYSNYKA